MAKLEIRLLGPVEASRDGEPVRLGGAKQRAALAVLALDAGRVVSAERLIDALWGSFPPPTASTALHGHVSRLRGLLGADAIETRPPGYALTIEPDAVDALRFELLLAARQLSAGLALWRGDALADVAGEPGLGDQARRLDELRLTAEEDLIDSELELGHHVELVPRLEERVSRDRLRERGVAQLVVALYRSGRPGDALAAYAALRARLREDVGLDPSPELRELERRVLVQDPSLAPPSAAPGPTPPRRVPVTAVAVELAAAASDAEVYGRTIGEAREAVRLVLEHHGASVQQPAGALVLGVFGIPAPHEDDAARALRAANEAVALGARVAVASGEAFGGETPAAAEALRLLSGGASLDVDELTHARARPRRHHGAPLVGREAEHSALRDAYASCVRDRKSRLIAVVGPPGIGKSRLVAELLASVGEEPSVLLARCLSYGDGVSLLPAIELVRSAAGIEANVRATDAAERLETLLAGDERSAAAVEQLLRLLGYGDDPPDEESSWAVRRLLECVAQRRPVVAVLDDLHWGSPPIHDLARQLGEAADVPLLTIVTARETPAGSTADVTELRPLDALACTAVVAALLDGTPADPATVDELVRASGGNPLFLEELVLSLRAGDAGPPRPLESLLAARLARLRTDVRGTVCCASVLGRSFSLDALSNLVEGAIEDTVGHAVAEGILQPTRFEDEDLEFRHLMMRDAAYASLPLARRAELHERHAQWRDRSPGIPPLESEALVVYHLDQAFRARQTLAPASASLADDARTIAARGTALGRMLLARGDAADAAALLARAHELTGDDATAVDLGRAQLDVGDFAAAERAFAAAEGPRARLGLVDVRFRVEPSADLAAAAAEIAAVRTELERAHDDTGLTEALLAAAYLAVVRGDAAALAAALEEALAVARRAGRSRAETWILFLLCSACWYGPLPVPDGLERCELILAEGAGRPGVEAAALQSLAVLHALDGAFGKARRRVAESRGLRRELGQRIGAAASAIDDGIVELLAGDPAAAARTLREGTAELERLGEQAYFSTAATLLGEALVSLGELDEAQRVAHAAADAAADDDVASQVGWRAVLARCGGADAEPLAREAVALADATDFLLLRAEAWAALADATGDERARERAHSALAEKRCAPAAIAHWTRAGL